MSSQLEKVAAALSRAEPKNGGGVRFKRDYTSDTVKPHRPAEDKPAYTRPYKYAPAKLADDESSEEEKEHEANEAK